MITKQEKIVGYWAKFLLGEKSADTELRKIIDMDTANAIFFITGFCGGPHNVKALKCLAKRVEEKGNRGR